MYNKDAVIEFLLDKSADKTPMEAASHIKSLKVKGLTLRSATKFKVLQDLNWLVISLPMKIAKTITCSRKNPGNLVIAEKSLVKQLKSCLFFIFQNVTELNLADNPAWSGDKESKKGDTYDDIQSARFICPVVGLEMNGRHRSVVCISECRL